MNNDGKEDNMSESYKIVYEGGIGEIEEKKSRFTAYVCPVESEEEASAFIEKIKKMNWNATHNCSAAVIGINNEFSRCNDDGEPGGTAGKPMLEVLIGEQVHNVAVVVTRYFGGTLLGTGGLVKAYQRAVKEGLAKSKIAEKREGARITVNTDYNGIGKLKYISDSMDIFIINTEYSDLVTMNVMAPKEAVKAFVDKVTEATAGKAVIHVGEIETYGIVNGRLI